MALIECTDCGKQVSDKAAACIGCGSPLVANFVHPGQPMQVTQVVKTAKSRGVFIILGLFLGCLGIHNFYAGHHMRGLMQLVITLLLGWLFIGFVITVTWALIELITVDTDGAGDRMV